MVFISNVHRLYKKNKKTRSYFYFTLDFPKFIHATFYRNLLKIAKFLHFTTEKTYNTNALV